MDDLFLYEVIKMKTSLLEGTYYMTFSNENA